MLGCDARSARVARNSIITYAIIKFELHLPFIIEARFFSGLSQPKCGLWNYHTRETDESLRSGKSRPAPIHVPSAFLDRCYFGAECDTRRRFGYSIPRREDQSLEEPGYRNGKPNKQQSCAAPVFWSLRSEPTVGQSRSASVYGDDGIEPVRWVRSGGAAARDSVYRRRRPCHTSTDDQSPAQERAGHA